MTVGASQPDKEAKDYIPRTKGGTWPAVLADAVRAGEPAHQKAFDHWCGSAHLANLGIALPSLAPVPATKPSATAPTGGTNCILHIVSCDNIRALGDYPEAIRLSPWLTVFYGRNGSGKSSLASAIAVLGGAIQHADVPGRANEDPKQDRYTLPRKATYRICRLNDVRANPISFAGGEDATWSSEGDSATPVVLRLFDKDTVDSYGAQLRLEVPQHLGLELFDVGAAALRSFEGGLTAVRTAATDKRKPLFDPAIMPRAEAAVSDIDEVATVDALKLAKQRDELSQQLTRLDQAEASAAAARKRIVKLEAELKSLTVLGGETHSATALTAASNELDTLRQAERAGLRGLLDARPLSIKDTTAWRSFVLAGEAVLTKEPAASYPGASDSCIYCGQSLSEAAVAFLKSIRQEVGGARSTRMSVLATQIDDAHEALRSLTDRLATDPALIEGEAWPSELPSRERMDSINDEVAGELEAERRTLASLATPESRAEARAKLAPLLAAAERRCFAKENAEKLAQLSGLNALLESVRTALAEVEAQKRSWSTARTEAMTALGLAAFKERFDSECSRLHLRLPLRLKAASPEGVTERRYAVHGREPRRILSESELATWALADCLTELSHRGANELLLVDDPFSSMDTERIAQVAERILDETEYRQVIVFTHNKHVFQCLVDAARTHPQFRGKAGRGPTYYMVESFKDTSGIVSPYSVKDTAEELLDRVQTMLGAGTLDQHSVELCFLLTRRAIEVLIDKSILHGVRTLFDPEALHTDWAGLKQIRTVPPELIDELQDLHSGISRLGGLHNTGTFHLMCPITEDVAYYHDEVRRLLAAVEAL